MLKVVPTLYTASSRTHWSSVAVYHNLDSPVRNTPENSVTQPWYEYPQVPLPHGDEIRGHPHQFYTLEWWGCGFWKHCPMQGVKYSYFSYFFLFSGNIPIFSYFSKKIPIFFWVFIIFTVILSLILLSMIFHFKKSFILYKVFSNFSSPCLTWLAPMFVPGSSYCL